MIRPSTRIVNVVFRELSAHLYSFVHAQTGPSKLQSSTAILRAHHPSVYLDLTYFNISQCLCEVLSNQYLLFYL